MHPHNASGIGTSSCHNSWSNNHKTSGGKVWRYRCLHRNVSERSTRTACQDAGSRLSLASHATRSGTDEGLVESELYAAKATAFIIMASNSTGVSFPNLRCLRLR